MAAYHETSPMSLRIQQWLNRQPMTRGTKNLKACTTDNGNEALCSYGPHFPLLIDLCGGDRTFLRFNDSHYSISTDCHQRAAVTALRAQGYVPRGYDTWEKVSR